MLLIPLSICFLIKLSYHAAYGQSGQSFLLIRGNTEIRFNPVTSISSNIPTYEQGSFSSIFLATRNIVYGISSLDGLYTIISQVLCPLVPNSNATQFTADEIQSQLLNVAGPWLAGIIVLTILGCIYGLCSIVTCCCVCGFRFNGFCGKERYQNLQPVTGLICLLIWAIFNIVSIVGTVIGVVIAIVSLTYASNAASGTISLPTVIPEAITSYANGLSTQINELTGQVDDLQGLYQSELMNFNTTFVGDILDTLRPDVMTITNNLKAVDNNVNRIEYNLNSTQVQSGRLNNTINAINTNLSSLQNSSQNAYNQCSSVMTILSAIDCTAIPSTSNLNLALMEQAIPGVDQIRSNIQIVRDQNLTGLANMVDSTFNGLQSTIDTQLNNSLQNASDTINGTFNVNSILSEVNIEQTIQDLINQLNITNLIPSEVRPVFDSFEQGINIAYYIIAAIFILIISIQLFFSALGLLLGLLGCNLTKLPSQRTSLSNVGGNLSAFSGYLGLCMLWPLLIITATIFFLGSTLTTICYPLADGTFFATTIDQNNSCGAGSGYVLGQIAFQNSSIPLTVSGVLNDCANDDGIFQAAQLQNLINITNIINQARTTLDDVGNNANQTVRDNINRTIPEIITPAQRMEINNAQTEIGNVNTSQLNDLNTNFSLDFDLSMSINDVRALQDTLTSEAINANAENNPTVLMFNDTLTMLINELEEFNTLQSTVYVPELNQISTEVNAIVINTTSIVMQIQTSITMILTSIGNIQSDLDNNIPNIIFNNTDNTLNRLLGYADSFLTHGEFTIRNDFGNCQTLSDIYNFLIDSTCRSLADSINGFWAAMGWTCIFILLTAITSFVLARYTQKKSYEFGFDDPESDDFSKASPYQTEQIHMQSTGEYVPPQLPPSYSVSEGQVYQNVDI